MDNERSIPSIVDGFKPGQRKVLFSCFKRNLVKELKVAQLAGSVAELSAYHHGEASLMSTIVNLAQNFVGANNINLLLPIGQFGTRLHGGKDSASPRYIFTALHPLTRLLFNPKDDPLFNYINDDGLKVEPEWYCPIIPNVLVNGAEGIGTGWSTKVPNYNPRDLISNIKLMLKGEETKPMKPFYKNFRGKIEQIDDFRVITSGEVAIIDDNTIEITELPIGTWTQAYKENVLETCLHGTGDPKDNKPAQNPTIMDYREYHTDTTVRFVVKFTPEQFAVAQSTGFHKMFKLQKTLSLNSMVMFDPNGCLRRYESPREILKEFFVIRSELYKKRKEYMEGMLGSESLKLDNIARFIMEKIEGKIKVENLKKAEICRILKSRKYDPDPVVKWKQGISREDGHESNELDGNSSENEEESSLSDEKKDYDYLLGMPIWNLTMEKKEDILKQQKQKGDELARLKAKTPNQLWMDDLDHFLAELDKYETKEKEEDAISQLKAFKASINQKGSAGTKSKAAAFSKTTKLEYLPTDGAEKVEPEIDPVLVAKGRQDLEQKEKQLIKKEATEIKELNAVDIITNSGGMAQKLTDEEIAKFAERFTKGIKIKPEPTEKPAKKTKVKEEKQDEDGVKNSKDKEPKNSIKNFFPKKEKKNASSDESEASVMDVSDDDDDDQPKERKPVRARKPAKYDVDEESDTEIKSKKRMDDSSDDFEKIDDDADEDDYEEEKSKQKSRKKTTSPKAVAKKTSPKTTMSKNSPKSKPKTMTKTQSSIFKTKSDNVKENKEETTKAKRSKAAIVSDDENVENTKPTKKTIEKKPAPASKATAKAPAAKKQKKQVNTSDSDIIEEDSDSDFETKKSKTTKKKLMDKESSYDIFKKTKEASKKQPAEIINDDDLYAID